MAEILVLAITGIFGVVAWLYQTALTRQTQRAEYYAAIIDNLTGFLVGASGDADKIRKMKLAAVVAARHLWLIAPPRVVAAGNAFFEAARGGGDEAEIALKTFILEMRKDASLLSVMSLWHRGEMRASDVRFYMGT
jgi:hypothetical protein